MTDGTTPAGGCYGKQAFDTPALAHKVLRRLSDNNKGRQAYRCKVCGKWHLGRSDRKIRRVE